MRGILKEAHIADLHFGAFDPAEQYKILSEQIIDKLEDVPLDIVSIDGDIFHHKAMANSDIVMYANKFIHELWHKIIIPKKATLFIISGTYSHDAGQLKLFYPYMTDFNGDIRIIENIQFEEVKGARILCIPELYGIDEEEYKKYLFYSGAYDSVFMHGTIKGAIMGDNVGQSRLFTPEDFKLCYGPIISGHVHTGGCFHQNFYYCGSPYPWSFGEEDQKGFLLVLHNLDTQMHLVYKYNVYSRKYYTVCLDEYVNDMEPLKLIRAIDNIKATSGATFLRVDFNVEVSQSIRTVLENTYRGNKYIKFRYLYTTEEKIIENNLQMDEYAKYAYLYDNSLTEYDKLAMYINMDRGYEFTTGEAIKNYLENETIF